jgi:anti-anti-sigma regulatory factor
LLPIHSPVTGTGRLKTGKETQMAICNYSEGVIIVELPPEPGIRSELDSLMEILRRGIGYDVVVDFAKVDIMTSLTLSGLLKVREIVAEASKRLIFVNASSITKDIFAVTCFDGIFEFADDRNEILAALAGEESNQPT